MEDALGELNTAKEKIKNLKKRKHDEDSEIFRKEVETFAEILGGKVVLFVPLPIDWRWQLGPVGEHFDCYWSCTFIIIELDSGNQLKFNDKNYYSQWEYSKADKSDFQFLAGAEYPYYRGEKEPVWKRQKDFGKMKELKEFTKNHLGLKLKSLERREVVTYEYEECL